MIREIPGALEDQLQVVCDRLKMFRATVINAGEDEPPDLFGLRLALRRDVGQHTPTPVQWTCTKGRWVIWIAIADAPENWQMQRGSLPPMAARMVAQESASGPTGAIGPTAYCPEWAYVSWAGESSMPEGWDSWFFREIIQLFETRAQRLADQWATTEQEHWKHVGMRNWDIPHYPTEGSPCPQVLGIVRFQRGVEQGPVTEQLLLEDLAKIRLVACVPKSIWEVFNRAVKLYAYGYQEWEFFTMARHYALLALEASLRALFAATLAPRLALKRSIAKRTSLLRKT